MPVTIGGAAQASPVTRVQVILLGQTLTVLTHRWPLNFMVGWLLFGKTYDNHIEERFFSSKWTECLRLVQKLFALFWKLFVLLHYFGCFCVELIIFHCWLMIWLISLLGTLIFFDWFFLNNTTQLFDFFFLILSAAYPFLGIYEVASKIMGKSLQRVSSISRIRVYLQDCNHKYSLV